jgi:hypothetical protein
VQEWLRELSLPENVISEFKENAVGGAGGCGEGTQRWGRGAPRWRRSVCQLGDGSRPTLETRNPPDHPLPRPPLAQILSV